MRNTISLALALLLSSGALLSSAALAAPDTLIYEGFVEDTGVPINGTITVIFDVFVDASGGVSLFTESEDVVATNGFFAAIIGDQTGGVDVAFATGRFLEVTIDGTILGRQEIHGVPFAMRAAAVDWTDIENKPAGFADDIDDVAPAGAGQSITHFGGTFIQTGGCFPQGPNSGITSFTFVAPSSCDIQIPGLTFSFNNHVAVATAINDSNFASISNGLNGALRVHLRTHDNQLPGGGGVAQFMVIVP